MNEFRGNTCGYGIHRIAAIVQLMFDNSRLRIARLYTFVQILSITSQSKHYKLPIRGPNSIKVWKKHKNNKWKTLITSSFRRSSLTCGSPKIWEKMLDILQWTLTIWWNIHSQNFFCLKSGEVVCFLIESKIITFEHLRNLFNILYFRYWMFGFHSFNIKITMINTTFYFVNFLEFVLSQRECTTFKIEMNFWG